MPEERNEKRTIEAALFMSGRELSLEEMKRLTGIAAFGYLQRLVEDLKREYETKGSAVEIYDLNGKYGMRVKETYIDTVKQFAQDSEISKSSLRTLAYIAKHDGVLKSELVKRMGVQAYQTVKELVIAQFVKSQRAGRTSKLTVTDKFRRYFKVVEGAPLPSVAVAREQLEAEAKEKKPQQTLENIANVAIEESAPEEDEMTQ